MNIAAINTPLNSVGVIEQGGAIIRLSWGLEPEGDETPVLVRARQQIEAYFAGELTRFDLPLRIGGSDFQRDVCAAMQAIPFGETRTYGDIATDLGVSAQAVGKACGNNPIPIIIPCHRVMGAGGRLTGYSGRGGVDSKVWLLRHEGAAGLLI